MRCLIETVRRGGVSETREIDTERLSLGSGADQDIRLQSRLAGLNHAVILKSDDGKLIIRTISPNTLIHNGKTLTNAVLLPGDELRIGSISSSVGEKRDGFELYLIIKEPTIRQSKELEEALLAGIGADSHLNSFPMRRTTWALSLGIIILFFLIPLAGFVYKPLGILLHKVPLVSDLSWNSGPISSAHSYFQDDCNACHEKAFESVQNTACTACHKDSPHHIDTSVKVTKDLESNRCASCHKEHSGSEALAISDDSLCTSCHREIKAIAPNSKLANVMDFGDQHPEFKATLASLREGKLQSIKVSLDQKAQLQEQPNLEFSHTAHLKKEGIKKPGHGNVKLECTDCHQPEPGGKYMVKLNFERQCHDCHQLNFEAGDPKFELPHGNEQSLQKYLEGYYAARALNGGLNVISAPTIVRERLRPGKTLTPDENFEIREWAIKYAREVSSEVMRFRVCGKCHSVSQNKADPLQTPWKIKPVTVNSLKLPSAEFDHDKHKTQECKDCHDAEKSAHSEDVLLKGIASCRECHGDAEAKNKVPTTCYDCHNFHTSQSLTMDGKKMSLPATPAHSPGTKAQHPVGVK